MQKGTRFVIHDRARAIKELEAARKNCIMAQEACQKTLEHIETMLRVEKGEVCEGKRPFHDWYPD